MFSSDSLLRRLAVLAAPIIGLNVLGVLALAVDTAMCGRLPNAQVAQTALGFATQMVFLLMVAMMGVTVGTVALVARAHGAGDRQRVDHILHQSTMLTILLSLTLAVVGNLGAPWVLRALGAEGDILTEALRYLRPLMTGVVFNYLGILYGATLRGVGNTRLAFFVSLGANVLNVVINYGLILGNYGLPSLGVQGAAIGTLCSQIFTAFTLGGLLAMGRIPDLKLKLKLSKLDPEIVKDLRKVGAPAALDFTILNVSFLALVGLLGNLEPVAVAAHGVGLRVQALAFVPGMSISQATAAMIGQSLGADDVVQAKAVVKAALKLCLGIMTSMAAVLLLLSDPIIAIFDVPAGTRYAELTLMWMVILGVSMPIFGLSVVFVGMMQGSGFTQVSLRINALSTFLVQVPLAFLLGPVLAFGPLGVWLSFPLGFVVKVILAGRVYLQGAWAKPGLRA